MKKTIFVSAIVMIMAFALAGCGKKTVSVELTACGDTPMKLIKEVQDITGLDLKDAKAIVDDAPQIVVKDVSEEEANEIKARLEAVSGTVTIK